jgi:hypothetical protein
VPLTSSDNFEESFSLFFLELEQLLPLEAPLLFKEKKADHLFND